MARVAWSALSSAALALACGRGEAEAERDPTAPSPAAQAPAAEAPVPHDLDGHPLDPLTVGDRPDALIFVRTDCPISNRYAPELARIAARFGEGVDVWLVYVDPDETPAQIREHVREYGLSGTPLRDPGQVLAAQAEIAVTPEAAVFAADARLRYHGRIDDWYVDYGKARASASTHELIDALEATLAGREPAVAHAAAVGCPLPPLPEPGPAR